LKEALEVRTFLMLTMFAVGLYGEL
jgi:hypothetical protein